MLSPNQASFPPVHRQPGFRDATPGERVRKIRQSRGWTQGNLGERMLPPMTHAAISDVERSRTQMTIGLAEELAEVLGVTRNDLIAQSEDLTGVVVSPNRLGPEAQKLVSDLGALAAIVRAITRYQPLVLDEYGIASYLRWTRTLAEDATANFVCDCHPFVESDTNAAIHDDNCASNLEEHTTATMAQYDDWRGAMTGALAQLRPDYPHKFL